MFQDPSAQVVHDAVSVRPSAGHIDPSAGRKSFGHGGSKRFAAGLWGCGNVRFALLDLLVQILPQAGHWQLVVRQGWFV